MPVTPLTQLIRNALGYIQLDISQANVSLTELENQRDPIEISDYQDLNIALGQLERMLTTIFARLPAQAPPQTPFDDSDLIERRIIPAP